MESKVRVTRRAKPKKPVKMYAIIISLIILFVLSGFGTYQYSKIKHFNNLIYPGVSIEGIDLSGKTKEQARKLVEKNYWNKILGKKINVKANDKTYTLKYSELKSTSNLDKVMDDAFNYGKNLIIFKKYDIIKHKKGKNFHLNFGYDKKTIDSFVSKIEKAVKVNPVNASLSLNGGNFDVTPGQNGKALDKDKLKKELVSSISPENFNDVTKTAVINTVKPRITSDKLSSVSTQVGSYSTNYGGSQPGRKNNIELATQAINGTTIMPGDVFSFNGIVGERTSEKGYQAAPVIIKDKLEPGIGGGICQVSTTLFNAVDKAGLESTERTHHTLPVHYVPEGKDATVDFGNIDYKFKNNFSSPVYIESYTSNGQIAFNIYSSGK
ncbi:VanW family protein [Clostridium oceanicum]|uniref:VanW family protein n=2 Tax=Clostridium oceanicum TaxID=1543 RepID=A0ABP3V1A3_9CLOT